MYCTQCGMELASDAKFCSHCGTKAVLDESEAVLDFTETAPPEIASVPEKEKKTLPQINKEEILHALSTLVDKAPNPVKKVIEFMKFNKVPKGMPRTLLYGALIILLGFFFKRIGVWRLGNIIVGLGLLYIIIPATKRFIAYVKTKTKTEIATTIIALGWLPLLAIVIIPAIVLEWEVGSTIFVAVVVVVGYLIIALKFQENYTCPRCNEMFTIKEIHREYAGTTFVEKTVCRTDSKWITIDGRSHHVRETKNEQVLVEAKVYHCTEKCNNCGFQRIVERIKT